MQGLREHIPTLPYEKRLSKVDTLKLAIGYINFLAETLTTGRNPNDATARPPVEQPKKVILHPHPCPSTVMGLTDVIAHSLTCRNERSIPHKGNKMLTRLWTPEDPRKGTNTMNTSSNSSSDIISSPEPATTFPNPSPTRQDILAKCCDALTQSP
jgi:hypothetical protein